MGRQRPDLPNNALLRYRCSLVPERIIEMEVLANDPTENAGDIKCYGKESLRLRVDKQRNVWWLTIRRDGWKGHDLSGNYDRLCGTRAELHPLPADLPVDLSTGSDPADYNR